MVIFIATGIKWTSSQIEHFNEELSLANKIHSKVFFFTNEKHQFAL